MLLGRDTLKYEYDTLTNLRVNNPTYQWRR